MNHQRITAMARAAANPNGTRKRFMGSCFLLGRSAAATGARLASGPRTLDRVNGIADARSLVVVFGTCPDGPGCCVRPCGRDEDQAPANAAIACSSVSW